MSMTAADESAATTSMISSLGPWRYEHRSARGTIPGDPTIASIEALYDSRAELESMLRFALEGRRAEELRVLDVGCLEGHYTAVAAQLGFKEVVGIDISPAHLKRAEFLLGTFHGLSNYSLHSCSATDVERLRALGPFDIVICHGILYHLKDPLMMFDVFEAVASGSAPLTVLLSTQFKGSFLHLISHTPLAELQVKAALHDGNRVGGKYLYSPTDQSVFERLSLRLNPAALHASLRQYGYSTILSLDSPRGYRFGYGMNLICRKAPAVSDQRPALTDHAILESVGVRAGEWDGRSVDGFHFDDNILLRALASLMLFGSKVMYRLTAGRHISNRARVGQS